VFPEEDEEGFGGATTGRHVVADEDEASRYPSGRPGAARSLRRVTNSGRGAQGSGAMASAFPSQKPPSQGACCKKNMVYMCFFVKRVSNLV
jgi:hypothetical protein